MWPSSVRPRSSDEGGCPLIKSVSWKTRLDLLSGPEIQAIHEASLRIMERTGLAMPLSPDRGEQAADLGLRVDKEARRIHFPPEIVEAALQKAPQIGRASWRERG